MTRMWQAGLLLRVGLVSMDSQTTGEVPMAGQRLLFSDDVDKMAQKIALLEQECQALTRERDLLARELIAAREEVTQLLRVLGNVTEPARRRTPQPPAAVPLWEKIRLYLEVSDRPKRAWQVQKALNLAHPPNRELARLVERKLARRVKEGIYTGVESPPTIAPETPPTTLQDRVQQFVLQAGKPISSSEVKAALAMTRAPGQELSKLIQQGKIQRVAAGRYSAPKNTRKPKP